MNTRIERDPMLRLHADQLAQLRALTANIKAARAPKPAPPAGPAITVTIRREEGKS